MSSEIVFKSELVHENVEELYIAPGTQVNTEFVNIKSEALDERGCQISPCPTPALGSTLGPQKRVQELQHVEFEVPSLHMFNEYDGSFVEGSAIAIPTSQISVAQCPQRPLYDAETRAVSNLGSENESEDNSDEDDMAQPIITRVFRAAMDTPEDDETIVASLPTQNLTNASLNPLEQHDLLDFQWRPFPNPPVPSHLRRESFNDDVGPTSSHCDPYDVFVNIWDRQFMEHIASETNRYAQQVAQKLMLSNKLQPNSRICSWKDTTADELYVFFAIVLAMGVVVKGRIVDYWSANTSIFTTPGFSVYMPLRRFQLLSNCLHFRNNEEMYDLSLDSSEAKLFKIQPVLDHLNSRFQSMYKLRQNLALDESLLQWQGLDINQFNSGKAAGGIKSYEICDPQTGYLWRFAIHAPKHTESEGPSSDPLETFTQSLVLELLKGLENKGHTVWMDSFYSSPALARKLKTLGFDCVGTLRTNRMFVPKELAELTKANMRPGEITGSTSGDVNLIVWRDQNRLAAISTYHGNAVSQVKGVTKPVLIHDYNMIMRGLDKKDKMLAAYSIETKTKVWYKKLFRRLLNVSVLNTFVICNCFINLSHRSCRMSLIESILKLHSPLAPPAPADLSQSSSAFSVREHHLAEFGFQRNLKGRNRRVCAVCKKRVTTYCAGCNKAACMSPCFVSMH